MTTQERIAALEALLARTEEAHGAYESAELKGVYDENWPSWYARYAVDHGIGDLLGREVTADQLGGFLGACWREYQQAEPAATEGWAPHTARHIAEALTPGPDTGG